MVKMVVNKRKLTKEEEEVNKKQIESLEGSRKWNEFQKKYYDLMLDIGLEQNYEKTRKEYKKMQKEFCEEMEFNDRVIKELKEQIENGVEVKEEIENKDEGIGEDEEKKYIG